MSKLLEGLKHYGDITVTQRTATGHDDSEKTTLYITKSILGAEDIGVVTREKALELAQYNSSEILGTITIVHSFLLAGTWSENLSRFIHLAQSKLENDGVLVQNDYGTYFMAE
jgi:hypothetical protein